MALTLPCGTPLWWWNHRSDRLRGRRTPQGGDSTCDEVFNCAFLRFDVVVIVWFLASSTNGDDIVLIIILIMKADFQFWAQKSNPVLIHWIAL